MKKNNLKKNKVKILEGALVGAVLGVAAGILLAPKSGNKLRSDIKSISGDFYRYITPQIKKLKPVGQEQYNAFISKSAKSYAKIKKLSLEEEKMLVVEAKRSWENIIRKYLE